MQLLAKGAAYRLLFMGFNFLLGLLIAMLSSREEFGMLSLMVVNGAVVHIVAGLGTESALVWHGAGKHFDKDVAFTFTFISVVAELLVFVLLSFAYYQYFDRLLLSQKNSSFIYFELLYFAGIVLLDKYSSLMYANQKAVSCNRFLSIVTLILVLFLVALNYGKFKSGLSSLELFCVIVSFQAISLVAYYHLRFSAVRFRFFSNENFRSFIRFSSLVLITNLVQFLAYRADYWILDHYRPPADLGVYAQAGRFAQLLWVLPNILASLAAPALLSATRNFAEKEMVAIIRKLNLYNLLLLLLVLLLADFIYSIFLQQYAEGFLTLLLMLPGFYFFCITTVAAAYFSAKRRLWVNFTSSLFCLVLILLSDFILIPELGMNGAAIANSIAYTSSALLNIYFLKKYIGTDLFDLFRFSKSDIYIFNRSTS